jgi:membrane protein DedA with SNARE-associated domain
VLFRSGRWAGTRLLGLYCRVTLASERCVEKALQYFLRYGPATLLLARFSASVRLFASACAGCSAVTYRRYLLFDAIGTVVYTSLWVFVGSVIGERAVEFLTTDRRRWIFMGVVVAAGLSLLGYRLGRRLRYGRAAVASVQSARSAVERR